MKTPPPTTIPRFLLPQKSPIWLPPSAHLPATIRHASQKASSKPSSLAKQPSLTLEKPTKFNPPSHGARLPKAHLPRHYGAPLSDTQREAQKKRKYPHMMPSEGTFLHWFLNNRLIHLWITLGTLFSLAGFTTVTHFKRTSPFADMLPPASDLFFHPVAFVGSCLRVFKLHAEHTSAEAAEARRMKVDDVAKRTAYRKAHGIEDAPLVAWLKGSEDGEGKAVVPVGVDEGSPINPMELVGGEEQEQEQEQVRPQKKPLKMWLGIW